MSQAPAKRAFFGPSRRPSAKEAAPVPAQSSSTDKLLGKSTKDATCCFQTGSWVHSGAGCTVRLPMGAPVADSLPEDA